MSVSGGPMRATNLLILCSDEHTPRALGCAGHPVVRTPNLDRLAARGTRFTSAYTPSPICVPARASLATGRYVHQIGCWSSAEPYDGRIPGWGHRLIDAGHRVVSIGKLHYRGTTDPNGFDPEILPMHVLNGVGWATALLRPQTGPDKDAWEYAAQLGPGETNYTEYDRAVRDAACDWLGDAAGRGDDKPWVLFVSFVSPHYPLIAPRDFFDLYRADAVDWPVAYAAAARPRHPVLKALTDHLDYDAHFTSDDQVRLARAGYYGLCSFLDDNIGTVLGALEDSGVGGQTRVLYTSDHGDMLGNHGIWAKSVMYEDSVGVPLILSGPDLPEGETVATPVSLIDIYQTAVEAVGATLGEDERALPGDSLIELARGAHPDRAVLSEYHDGGAITGFFMLRYRRWKYVYYVGEAPQLFDLEGDPDELVDLGESPSHAEIRADCEARLRAIVDPEAASDRAFADQAARIAALGGEAAVRRLATFGFTPVPDGSV